MRRTFGPLLLLPLLLAGCGEEDTVTDDPTSSTSPTSQAPGTDAPTPDAPTTDAAAPVVLGLVHATNAGGTVSDVLTPIGGDGLLDFLTQLDSSSLSEQVMSIADANPPAEGRELMAAVVAIGCDVPPGASVAPAEGSEGWAVNPAKVITPLQECVAAVTTVAVVDVPGPA